MKCRQSIIRFTTILLTATLVVISASAQEASSQESTSTGPKGEYSSKKDIVENPFKPADTSSPRDTLRSFLTNINIAIKNLPSGLLDSPAGYQAYERALSTLDFSTTPDGDSRVIMNRRLLMLKEILDRIELPPYSEIPGDDEVGDGALNQWTIPGTSITIKRLESGPRAGEYLFSAWTVQRLPRLYRQVKNLPYQPNATPGIYETYLSSETSASYLDKQVRNRLKPVDTSSPRSTLEGFLDSVNRAYGLVMEADAAAKASPPTITNYEAREIEIIAQNLMARAESTLDLSKVPEAIRDAVGIESALTLKEIFDRMLIPEIESIPDTEMVKAERERLSSTASGNTRPVRWRYPNTAIEIVEIMEGERQGSFLFSAETVDRLKDFYEQIRDLPYRGDYSQLALDYESPGKSEGFFEYYISTPGYLVPHASLLGRFVESLPSWFKKVHGGQTVWQWIFLALWLSLGVLLLVTLHGRVLRGPAELSPLNRYWRRVFFYLVAAGTVLFLYQVLNKYVNLTGPVLYVSGTILETTSWLFLSAVVIFLGGALAETIVASPKIDPEGIQASYIRALFGVVCFIAAAAILISGLSKVGLSLIPILTGVGIGGLAIALAARPTIENIIASFMIFLDKPYRVGQRINVLGQDGTVEAIGLRSTKIRLLTGHLTSIPNEKMATVEIVNIGRRPYIRRLFDVTITYDTPPEKVTRALEILREILAVPEAVDPETTHGTEDLADTVFTEGEAEHQPHPNEAINQPDFPPRVSFNELNADSLNILVIYWYHPPDYWDYLEHATWINLQIMERFNAEGIDFAFPTQTLHMAGDEKRPLTVGQHWVSEEEAFSPNSDLAQAAAPGAQAVQTTQTSASETVRPQVSEVDDSKPKTEGELTDAPLEDDVLHGDSEGEADDDGDAQR